MKTDNPLSVVDEQAQEDVEDEEEGKDAYCEVDDSKEGWQAEARNSPSSVIVLGSIVGIEEQASHFEGLTLASGRSRSKTLLVSSTTKGRHA